MRLVFLQTVKPQMFPCLFRKQRFLPQIRLVLSVFLCQLVLLWCRLNFHFDFVPLHNSLYNSHLEKSTDFTFPYPDESFDKVYLFSVFTHMKIEDIQHYLSEISRVLKNEGQCLMTSFTYQEKEYQTHIQMVGRYNVYNYLTAMLLIHELGYEIDAILALNTKLKAPKGRMELIVYGTNGIFVDYAHTPDATLNVLESAQEFKKGKIITIIGCGGDRDTTKRPIMGEIACKHSDHVIITDDNPRTEDPQKIINDILKGVSGDYEVINDRHLAIAKGMSLLKENDILMILGKGHEDYQIIGTEKIHFSDQEEVEKYIREHIHD